jgi:hypothetical protein
MVSVAERVSRTKVAVGYSSCLQQAIEEQVLALTRGVHDCIETSGADAAQDASGDRHLRRRQCAAQIAAATARLLQSAARLKGEFRYDYRTTRLSRPSNCRADPDKHPDWIPWNGDESLLLTQTEYDALRPQKQWDYDRWTEGLPPVYGGWKKPNLEPDTLSDAQAAAADPPDEKCGSNAGH